MRICHLRAPNGPFFLVQIVITFIYILALFIVKNFFKNYHSGSRVAFAPNKNILENYYYHFHLPIRPFYCGKFKKKFIQPIQSHEDVQFLDPKLPISQMRVFSENLLMSLVSFIHAYLHAKNQNQILIY